MRERSVRPILEIIARAVGSFIFLAPMVSASELVSATTGPPPPRTLEHIVGDAAYVVVGVPQRTKYLGYDTRIPEEYGREFTEPARGRIRLYEVQVKRVLYAQDSALPKSLFLGFAALAGPDAARIKRAEEYVFFFYRYSKMQIKEHVVYVIIDPPLDRAREKEVSEVIARIRKERDRK